VFRGCNIFSKVRHRDWYPGPYMLSHIRTKINSASKRIISAPEQRSPVQDVPWYVLLLLRDPPPVMSLSQHPLSLYPPSVAVPCLQPNRWGTMHDCGRREEAHG